MYIIRDIEERLLKNRERMSKFLLDLANAEKTRNLPF